jgi:hypothetical protein
MNTPILFMDYSRLNKEKYIASIESQKNLFFAESPPSLLFSIK